MAEIIDYTVKKESKYYYCISVVSGRDFALSVREVHLQNVAAGFSLPLHRLEACVTKAFSDEDEDEASGETKNIMSKYVGWARPTFMITLIFIMLSP